MAAANPNNLGHTVTSRTVSWNELVERAWGTEWRAPDHNTYVFSNGRSFDSTDKGNTGFYNGGAR